MDMSEKFFDVKDGSSPFSMYKGRTYILGRVGDGLAWLATASGSVICPDLN
jgi:hypothetical protein